jgi:nucleotidyltransferase/DNA polymerase involved in DNA repair
LGASFFKRGWDVPDRDDERRIACVTFPHFLWQVAAQSGLAPHDGLMIVASGTADRSRRTVADVSPGVTGVIVGMPLEQALSRHPGAVVADADVPAAEAILEEAFSAIEQITPDVEPAGLGSFYLAIHGLERLYGGDAFLVKAISQAITQVSTFDLRIGIGTSKWLAYVAAIHSKPNCAFKLSSAGSEFLRHLPLSALPIDLRTIERMEKFGWETLGDLSSKPRGAIAAQFGAEGATAWDLANGIDHSPFVPRRAVEKVSEYLEFPDATVNLMSIVAGIESLLARGYSRPALNNRHARRCSLQAQVFQAAPWTLEVAFKEPAGSKSEALFAIKTKLDTVTVPGPLEDLRITLLELTGEPARQESMWLEVRRQDDLSQAIAQLQERIGEPPPIYRVQELRPDSKVPEWRNALVQLSR